MSSAQDDSLLFALGMTEFDMKVCPQCGQKVFADMDTCYECLYSFAPTNHERPDYATDEQVPTEAYESSTHEEEELPAHPSVWVRIFTRSMDIAVPIPKGGLTIGRGSDCQVVLHNRAVSRHHVRLQADDGVVRVYDLGARNAPTINGGPVEPGDCIRDGDDLRVCNTRITLASPSRG